MNNNLNNVELRRYNSAPEIRMDEVRDERGESVRYLSGYAVVFEEYSRSFWDEWVEIIDKQAFANADMSDVVMVVDHSHEVGDMLARSKNGAGTLEITVDEVGVKFRFPLPNTSIGRDLAELVERGDISECSFAFWVKEDNWTYDVNINGKVMDVRRIIAIDKLADLSIVVRGQYAQPSVGIDERSLAQEMRKAVASKNNTRMSIATAKAICNL